MKIVFVSNFINHHQKPISDEFYRLSKGQYWFISTQPIPYAFIKAGYPDYSNLSYVICAYSSAILRDKSIDLINNADVVIAGANSDEFLQKRISENRLTFRCSERFFKSKPWYKSLGGVKHLFFHDTIYRYKKLYMLAASAYLANDMKLVGAYPNKIFKWGYFTEVPLIDIDAILLKKRKKKLVFIWCARFLEWKHPEIVPLLASRLLSNGFEDFEIQMYGSGILYDKIRSSISSLNVGNYVFLKGNLPNIDIIHKMREANIFLFTSDRNEGWGAVLNEAMSAGCAVVASDEIGAVPYLIENNVNGLIFRSKSVSDLYDKVLTLINNRSLMEEYAKNAYFTMKNFWSPQIAAVRFVELSENLLMYNKILDVESGPCSRAFPITI